jgi:hypothetical protein
MLHGPGYKAVIPRCYSCNQPFPANDLDELSTRGCTIAYDPVRGRLWFVCTACRRWSLRPIDERWDVIDSLERLSANGSRVVARTDNIALIETGGLRLVRVGRAGLREEAWWRYGRELQRRHERSLAVAGRNEVHETVLDALTPIIAFLLVGWPIRRTIEPGVEPWLDRARWLDFGPFAWRGVTKCPVCRSVREEILLKDTESLAVRPADPDIEIWTPCSACRLLRTAESGYVLHGDEAKWVLRRVLAYQNYDGASERQIDTATRLIEDAGTPCDLMRTIIGWRLPLGRLRSTELLSLEIASNAEEERRIADLEISDLEDQWRREEEIAAIVDGELTP